MRRKDKNMPIKLLDDSKIEIGSFPDHTHIIRVESQKLPDQVTVKWNYASDEELFSLVAVTRYLQEHGVSKINLRMPYIPNARFDRVNNPDEVFTLKYFAEIINSLNFNKVYVLDAHSNVSLALINNVVQMDVKSRIQKAIDSFKPDVLFMPDEGAHKRYSSMFDMPSTFGIKTRDWRTGTIKDYFLADLSLIKDNRVLIIDDISSRGGTFYHAGCLLHNYDPQDIGLYVSHCEPTIAEGEVLKPEVSHISQVYTADPLWDATFVTEQEPALKAITVID